MPAGSPRRGRVTAGRIPFLAIAGLAVSMSGCAGSPTVGPGADGRLPPCPSTPNCVSSDADGAVHGIAPLEIVGAAGDAWRALADHLEAERGVTIVERTDDFLAAEARTRLLRFTDDVAFVLRADRGQIAMRSASRLGLSDFGTNRRRLESIRAALAARGVVKPAD